MLGFSYGFGMKEGGSESAYDRGWEMMVDFQEDGLRGILWRGLGFTKRISNLQGNIGKNVPSEGIQADRWEDRRDWR